MLIIPFLETVALTRTTMLGDSQETVCFRSILNQHLLKIRSRQNRTLTGTVTPG